MKKTGTGNKGKNEKIKRELNEIDITLQLSKYLDIGLQ